MDVDGLQIRLAAAGQSHLLQFWDQLTAGERQSLYDELNQIDMEEVNKYFKDAEATLKMSVEKIDDHLECLPPDVCGSVNRTEPNALAEYNKQGTVCSAWACTLYSRCFAVFDNSNNNERIS